MLKIRNFLVFFTISLILFFLTVSAWPSDVRYVVKPGDTLWVISRRCGVSLEKLMKANGLTEDSVLQIGTELLIPSVNDSSQVKYQVRPGDTLWAISRSFGVSLKSLMEANGLSEQSILREGQTIVIPTGEAPQAGDGQKREELLTATTRHRVQKGESLWLISRFYGVDMRSIMEANGLDENSVLQVGMELVIPLGEFQKIESPEHPAVASEKEQEMQVYEVCPGDTLWSISRRFGVSINSLLVANNLSNPDKLKVGQSLVIPPAQKVTAFSQDYVVYEIQKGDTLWSISRRFKVSMELLASVNGLTERSILRIGQKIRIPSHLAPNYGGGGGFTWPLRGRITSYFERRSRNFHYGIDIAAPPGSIIRAAQSGVVTYSGWMSGYGRVVIISHPNGFQTLYAHNSANLVTRGERVNRGDPIARVGRTGNATGYHLHFEVRVNNKAVDPLQYLRGG